MVKETSTTESTLQKVEANTSTAAQDNSNSSQPSYVSKAELKELEYRLSTKAANSSGGKTGLLWIVTLIALGAAGFSGYTAFQNQQKLAAINNDYANAQSKITDSINRIEQSANLLETAQHNNSALQQSTTTLTQNYQSLAQTVNRLISAQQAQGKSVSELSDKIDTFQSRNPYDWQLAEAYFLVNNAQAKGVFEKDIKAAVWMLTQADELLVGIEDEKVVALRETISQDISTLNNIAQVDMRGLGLELDRAYDNVDKLVLEGYSDPKVREAAMVKVEQTTENLADWKENLLNSANQFASRFVEIRRRNAEAATEFLTPEQDLYLRENIKTRILLAKADLSHGDKESMQSNLNAAVGLINTYFDTDSLVVKNTIEMLDTLSKSEITIKTPDVLQSAGAFSTYAREHLLGRGK